MILRTSLVLQQKVHFFLAVTEKEFIRNFRGHNVFADDSWGLLAFLKGKVMLGILGLTISDMNGAKSFFHTQFNKLTNYWIDQMQSQILFRRLQLRIVHLSLPTNLGFVLLFWCLSKKRLFVPSFNAFTTPSKDRSQDDKIIVSKIVIFCG